MAGAPWEQDEAVAQPAAAPWENDAPAEAPSKDFFPRLGRHYSEEVGAGLTGMKEGAARATAPDASLWERTKGAGQALVGGVQYGMAPIEAPWKAVVVDPAETAAVMAGAGPGVQRFVSNTADAAQMLAGPGMARMAGKIPAAIESAVSAAKPFVNAVPKEVAPTANQLYSGAKNAYAVVDNSGIRVSPEPFQNFADQLAGNLKGYNPKVPSIAPDTNKILKELREYANEEDSIKFSELADLKSNISDAIHDIGTKKRDKYLLSQISDHLDNFTNGLTPEHLDVGEMPDIEQVQGALTTAKDLWHKQAKMSKITEIMDVAADQKYPDRYIQQKFTALTKNPKKMADFTPDEQKIIVNVAKGGSLDTVAKWLAPSGDRVGLIKGALGSTIGAAGAAALGLPGIVGGVAAPAIGMGAKAISETSRLKGVRSLQDTIALGRKPLTYRQRLELQQTNQPYAKGGPVHPGVAKLKSARAQRNCR